MTAPGGTFTELRDIRPDGAVIARWLCAPGMNLHAYGYHPANRPQPPYRTEARELPDGEWVTIAEVTA